MNIDEKIKHFQTHTDTQANQRVKNLVVGSKRCDHSEFPSYIIIYLFTKRPVYNLRRNTNNLAL